MLQEECGKLLSVDCGAIKALVAGFQWFVDNELCGADSLVSQASRHPHSLYRRIEFRYENGVVVDNIFAALYPICQPKCGPARRIERRNTVVLPDLAYMPLGIKRFGRNRQYVFQWRFRTMAIEALGEFRINELF